MELSVHTIDAKNMNATKVDSICGRHPSFLTNEFLEFSSFVMQTETERAGLSNYARRPISMNTPKVTHDDLSRKW